MGARRITEGGIAGLQGWQMRKDQSREQVKHGGDIGRVVRVIGNSDGSDVQNPPQIMPLHLYWPMMNSQSHYSPPCAISVPL